MLQRVEGPDHESFFLALDCLRSSDSPRRFLHQDLALLDTLSLLKPSLNPVHQAPVLHCDRVSAKSEWNASDQF